MSDHGHHVFDALRRLDRPAELDVDVEAHIEAEMLTRFDDRAGSGPTTDDGPQMVITLEDARGRPGNRRSNPVAMAVAAAVAAIVVVAGIALVSTRDEPAPASPPTTGPSSTTISVVDETTLVDQLEDFCTSYVLPLRAADDLWRPDGSPSEMRTDVLIATEQAVQAMNDVGPPLGDRWASNAEGGVVAVTDARLAVTLLNADADDAILGARDTVFLALANSGSSQLPETCLP